MEAALADIDAALPASGQAARELEENAWLRPQTEWREQISAEAASAFSAALDAQRGIKEVALALPPPRSPPPPPPPPPPPRSPSPPGIPN